MVRGEYAIVPIGGWMPVRRAPAREDAILLATMGLLAEVGYDRMTMDAVAKRARASKATIYRRWSGKADLVSTAVRRYAGRRVTAVPEMTTLREDMFEVLRAVRASLTDEEAATITGLLVAMRHDHDLARIIRRHVLDDKREVFAAGLARAVGRGDAPTTVDGGLLAEISTATLFFRLLITGEPLDDEFLSRFVDAVVLPLLNRGSDQH